MARMKRGMLIASTLILASLLLSACNKPYSQAAATFTPASPSNLFASAQPTDMVVIQAYATGSAIAKLTTSPGAPAVSTATLAPGVTPPAVTATNTPAVVVNPTSTSTLAVAPNAPTAAPAPAGSHPASYTLQNGEFPFCIARRFNINPDELLAANGLANGDLYYAGQVLKIPQGGSPFPGDRMLRNHPSSYTVSTSDETIYSVACAFGDVDPNAIATKNGITAGAALTAGQTLSIP